MPKQILIDSDVALGDWVAILYLLREPEADVRAITVAATGEAHARPGVHTALRLLALADHPHIPVCAGPSRPLKGNKAFPFKIRLMVDLRGMLKMPLPRGSESPRDAVSQIIHTLEQSADPVILVAIGPLTNVGLALQKRPDLKNKLAEVIIMGGAVDVPGNIMDVDPNIQNRYAEWNIFCDPHSANLVFASGAPVTLVPLEATNDVPFSRQFLQRLAEHNHHPWTDFLIRALQKVAERLQNEAGRVFYFWDALAAVLALHPELGLYETHRVRVVEEDGPEWGRVVRSENGYVIKICTGADRAAFEQIFMEGLNR